MEQAWAARQEAFEDLTSHRKLEITEKQVNERMEEILKRSHKPLERGEYKEDFVYYEPHTGGLPSVVCTCGWKKSHVRFRVLSKAAERHFYKTGHNTRRA